MLRVGLLSTATAGRAVAAALRGNPAVRITAVAGRDPRRTAAFAAETGIPRALHGYGALLTAPDVDAIYVALPNAYHPMWTVRALEAGRHVLCEAPLALTVADARRCSDAARLNDRRLAEGLLWRLHPRTALARRLLADGAIGRLTPTSGRRCGRRPTGRTSAGPARSAAARWRTSGRTACRRSGSSPASRAGPGPSCCATPSR